MNHIVHSVKGTQIVEIKEPGSLIRSAQDFLDIIVNLKVKTIILFKENLDGRFFDLGTGLAGDILQKASNYRVRVGIVGDFSRVKSRSLRDFIYESNKTGEIVFVDSVDKALEKFSPRE